MPGTFTTAIVLFVIAFIALLVAAVTWFLLRRRRAALAAEGNTASMIDSETSTQRYTFTGAGAVCVVVALIAAIFTIVSAYDRVDTRNVGIKTSFGNPNGVHTAGVWWHAPWEKVSELSEAYQLQSFESNGYEDASNGKRSNDADTGPAVLVRLANNSNAYVVENFQWRLKEGAAGRLFQDYGGNNVFDTIKSQLVDKQAQTVLSKVFTGFNPQAQEVATNANLPGAPGMPPIQTVTLVKPDLTAMAKQVTTDLQAAVGDDIEIQFVNLPRIFYDPNTQSVIDGFNTHVQQTQTAIQDANTAIAQKQQNDTIASSVQNPMVVISKCINDQLALKQQPVGCWPVGGTPLINLPQPAGH